jgi:hypothetical protein
MAYDFSKFTHDKLCFGERDGAVGKSKNQVRFQIVSLEFVVDRILPAAPT